MPKGGWRGHHVFKPKSCGVCGTEFKPYCGGQKYCSVECGLEPAKKHWATEAQYKLISGDWSKYFSRLSGQHGRKGQITRDDLLKKLEEQNNKCALTGVEMTCNLELGTKCWTNASLDRIEAGGSYDPDNVQLVCRAVNGFRREMSVEDFIDWCEKVVRHSGR